MWNFETSFSSLPNNYRMLANNLIQKIHNIENLKSNFLDIISKNGFLVADENTVKLLKSGVINELNHYIIPSNFANATEDIVNYIRKKATDSEFLIAFGSGTINDICKYASFLEGKYYVSCPTAASMNGYISANASIKNNKGYSTSIASHLPRDIYIDLDIVSTAPSQLACSGFADFMCRSTAQADWMLSHMLTGSSYINAPFTIVQEAERELLQEYLGLLNKSRYSIKILMKALLLSGIGMTIVGNSSPASQGEHMIAQTMDLVQLIQRFHGEKIGVTTLTMAKLQNMLLSKQPFIKPTQITENEVYDFFKRKEFIDSFHNKKISQEKANVLNDKISQNWTKIANKIRAVTIPAESLQKMLINLNMPYKASDLGWEQKLYQQALDFAFITKDRFTFLDLKNCGK